MSTFKVKTPLDFCHQETCCMSFCCILHFSCFDWKAAPRANISTGLFTCNWDSRTCQSTWDRDRCIMQLMQRRNFSIDSSLKIVLLPCHPSDISVWFISVWSFLRQFICGIFLQSWVNFWTYTLKLSDLQFISTHPTSRQRTLIYRSMRWYFPIFLFFFQWLNW